MESKKIYASMIAVFFLMVGVVFWGINQPEKANAPVIDPGSVEGESTTKENATDEIIYYYGETCPHCIDLNKFLEENKIAEKVNFSKKEVWGNKANAAEMEKKAAECDIERSGMGVPFVYARGKCYVGTPQAEALFKQEAGL